MNNIREAKKLPSKQRWCCTDRYGVYIGPGINNILTHYCTEFLFDSTMRNAFVKDMDSLGQQPDDSAGALRFLKRYEECKDRHARPEIDRMLPVVRAEMARLDAAWTTYAAASSVFL